MQVINVFHWKSAVKCDKKYLIDEYLVAKCIQDPEIKKDILIQFKQKKKLRKRKRRRLQLSMLFKRSRLNQEVEHKQAEIKKMGKNTETTFLKHFKNMSTCLINTVFSQLCGVI